MNAVDAKADAVEQFDLQFIISALATRWRWVLLSTLVFFGLFAAAAFMMTPVYRVTTVIVPVSSERDLGVGAVLGQIGGLASFAGLEVGTNDLPTEEALAVLRSQEFIGRFILDNNLLPVFFASKWDADADAWKPDTKKIPTLARGVDFFLGKVFELTQDKKTGLVSVTIDWKDRQEAARWSMELVRRVNEEMRARALRRADQSIAFLEHELERARLVESRDAIGRLMDSEIRQRMVANVTSDFAFRVVDKGVVPDEDNPVRPKKFLMLVFGPLFGAAFGVLVIVFWQLIAPVVLLGRQATARVGDETLPS
jgi:uncharacterized protein involved in exopolysaccharide biosynthesis